jgi:nucleoside-diphosphate-sugar epimerase
MKILVSGAAGFLGQACVRLFSERGHGVETTDRHGAVAYLGDLRDGRFVARLPPADAVVHAAAVQYVSPELPLVNRKRYFYENNVVTTAHLCERYANEATHFVNVGTSMMYEQNGSACYSTASRMGPQGIYSSSKLKALNHVQSLKNPNATVIPCIIGGVGREGLFRQFVSNMKRLGIVAFPGTGIYPTSLVHVNDVALLIAAIVESSRTGLYNAAAPHPLSILQWVREIEDELDLKSVRRLSLPLKPIHLISAATGFRFLAREQLLMLAQAHVLDIEKSLAIGWKPQYNNAMIIRQTARHIAGG